MKNLACLGVPHRECLVTRISTSAVLGPGALERHPAQPHAGQREDGVSHGGRDRRQAGLADAGGLAVVVEDLDDDLGASNIRSTGKGS